MWCVQVVSVDDGQAVGQAKRFAHRWQAVPYGLRCGNVPPGYELAMWEKEEQPGALGGSVGACAVWTACRPWRSRPEWKGVRRERPV
jgi:hypothetical protein